MNQSTNYSDNEAAVLHAMMETTNNDGPSQRDAIVKASGLTDEDADAAVNALLDRGILYETILGTLKLCEPSNLKGVPDPRPAKTETGKPAESTGTALSPPPAEPEPEPTGKYAAYGPAIVAVIKKAHAHRANEPGPWDVKTEGKVRRVLGKIFKETGNREAWDAGVLDPNHVLLCAPLSERARRALAPYQGEIDPVIPRMSHTLEGVALYSADMAAWAWALIEAGGPASRKRPWDVDVGHAAIGVGEDYPLIMADRDWLILLAPRI